MVWFRVDDVLPFHERVIRAGNAAMGLWVRAGAWSSGQLTDGHIPHQVARQMGTPAEIRRLVEVGLWVAEGDGYQFHAWSEDGTGTKRQPNRAEILEKRRVERDRKAAYRRGHHDDPTSPELRGTTPDVPTGHPTGHPVDVRAESRQASGHPDPTRPDPVVTTEIELPSGRSISAGTAADATGPAATTTDLALVPTTGNTPARTSSYPAGFEAFWAAYPRHEGKRKALTAWEAACRRADPRRILDGARRYAADPNREDPYTAHPTTWLHRDGWDDAPLPQRRPQSQHDRLAQNAQDTLATLARMGVA